jgi:alkylation response protein AidB-like acyl-CoA dehydrogenase
MATELEASRLMVRHGARLITEKAPNYTMYCAMAKQYATDKCWFIVNDCLQMHGGYGYLQDYPIERFLRDLRVHSILEGTNEIMSHIIQRTLLKDD